MGRIRFVGRARGGRCVLCHDGLGAGATGCDACSATWHPECLTTGRCPTLGCGQGVAPEGARAADDKAGVAPDVVEPRGRPGRAARFGPTARLAWSTLAHAALLLGGLFMGVVGTSEGIARGELGAVAGGIATALGGLWFGGRGLLRLRRIAREVSYLLEHGAPVLMDLEVRCLNTGRHREWCVRLRGRPGGPYAGRTFDLPTSFLLTPWWVTIHGEQEARPVRVWGLPPPGPYIIEFPGGALALVQPDSEDVDDDAGRHGRR